MAGLQSYKIDKIRSAWTSLGLYETLVFRKLQNLLNPCSNFKSMRGAMNEEVNTRKPHMPILMIYLGDLFTTHEIEKCNPVEYPLLNFKLAKQEAVVKRKAQLAHETKYEEFIQPIPSIQNAFEYDIPKYIESKDKKVETLHSLDSEADSMRKIFRTSVSFKEPMTPTSKGNSPVILGVHGSKHYKTKRVEFTPFHYKTTQSPQTDSHVKYFSTPERFVEPRNVYRTWNGINDPFPKV
jgi:hypothetical protein